MKLLVSIMSVCSKYENNDFRIVNFVNKPMFLGDTSAPFTRSIARKGLGLSGASARMLFQLCFQFQKFLKSLRFFVFQFSGVLNGLFLISDCVSIYYTRFRRSSMVSPSSNLYVGPFFASSTRAKNSSFVKRVASSFSATSLRKYLAARFSKFSSSAMMLMLRSTSAFNCVVVISLSYFITAQKYEKYLNQIIMEKLNMHTPDEGLGLAGQSEPPGRKGACSRM